jgi:hypothetical protein
LVEQKRSKAARTRVPSLAGRRAQSRATRGGAHLLSSGL